MLSREIKAVKNMVMNRTANTQGINNNRQCLFYLENNKTESEVIIMKKTDKENAKMFCDAIRVMIGKPENIDNLESYLENCFADWMKIYASDPEGIAREMKAFADMEIQL